MSKLGLIIAREYKTRVRKKSFIIMTILGPVLFGALMFGQIWLTTMEDQQEKTVAVVEFDMYGNVVPDSSMMFKPALENKPLLKFEFIDELNKKQVMAIASTDAYYGVLMISYTAILAGDKSSVAYLSSRQPSLDVQMHIERSLEEELYKIKLKSHHLPVQLISSIESDLDLDIQKIDSEGNLKKSGMIAKSAIGYISGFLIYFFILFFSSQVMRGIVEEKTNRIIEVIVTSVKPFQLMLGKIAGIGLVGLTQFLAWVIMSLFIFTAVESYMLQEKIDSIAVQQEASNLFESSSTAPEAYTNKEDEVQLSGLMAEIYSINFTVVILSFIFYFIGGFMLYASMFAAIGAMIDNETDTQQFMMPVTIPLILAFFVGLSSIANPEGQVAYWFSLIPFTSPIVMMCRIGFGIPLPQVLLSGIILIATFIGVTWMAGKIYRTGILMYGKKASYKELFKWLRYK